MPDVFVYLPCSPVAHGDGASIGCIRDHSMDIHLHKTLTEDSPILSRPKQIAHVHAILPFLTNVVQEVGIWVDLGEPNQL